ncbi:MAG: AmmeMemoRadiSam system protein A [Anaerolineae bacterium]
MDERNDTPGRLTSAEADLLLQVARAALQRAVQTGNADEPWLPPIEVPEPLLEEGASFVTLHVDGALRGCIGSAQAYRPVLVDVASNAMRAALLDPRFDYITQEELPRTEIEISILTPLMPLAYRDGSDLTDQLRPHIDGVMVVRDHNRALLLPQTWDLAPDRHEFMAILCRKAGLPDNAYMEGDVEVYTFQVYSICEG